MRTLVFIFGLLINITAIAGTLDNTSQIQARANSSGVTWTIVDSDDFIGKMTLSLSRYCSSDKRFRSHFVYDVRCHAPTLALSEGQEYVGEEYNRTSQNIRTIIDFSVGGKAVVTGGSKPLRHIGNEGDQLGRLVLDLANSGKKIPVHISWVDGQIIDHFTAKQKYVQDRLKREGYTGGEFLIGNDLIRWGKLRTQAERAFPTEKEYWIKATRNIHKVAFNIEPSEVQKLMDASYDAAKLQASRKTEQAIMAAAAIALVGIGLLLLAYRVSRAAYRKSKHTYLKSKDDLNKKRVARLVEDEALKVQVRKEMQSAPATTESILKEQINDALNRGDSKLATELLELFKLSQERASK